MNMGIGMYLGCQLEMGDPWVAPTMGCTNDQLNVFGVSDGNGRTMVRPYDRATWTISGLDFGCRVETGDPLDCPYDRLPKRESGGALIWRSR